MAKKKQLPVNVVRTAIISVNNYEYKNNRNYSDLYTFRTNNA